MKKLILSQDVDTTPVVISEKTDCDVCGEVHDCLYISDAHTYDGEDMYICYTCIKQLSGLVPAEKKVVKIIKKKKNG